MNFYWAANPAVRYTSLGADIQSIGTWNGTGAINTGINLNATGGATNVGLNVNVSGGTTNYAGLFNGGRVGIGTSVPHNLVHIHDNKTALTHEIIRFSNGTTLNAAADGVSFGFANNGQNFYMDNKEGAGFQWWTNGTERMRITGAGILSLNNNNNPNAFPPYNSNGGGALSWNYTNNDGEVSIWNNVSAGAKRGFSFRQMTSASTQEELMRLEANGGIFGKFRHITYHSYNNSSYRGPNTTPETNWFPAANGDGGDDCWCALTSDAFRRAWVAPYNGRLVKVVIRINQDSGSNPDVQGVIRLNVNGTDYDFTTTPVLLNDNGVQTITLPTTGFSFNAGDRIFLGLHKRGNNSDRVEDLDIFVTAVWEYNIQD